MVDEKLWAQAYDRSLADGSKTQTEHYRILLGVPSAAPVVTEHEFDESVKTCRHCGYGIGVAKHREFAGKYVHALTGNWLCALSAEPMDSGEGLKIPVPDAVVSHRSELNWKHGIRNFMLSGEGKDAERLDEIAAEAYQKFAATVEAVREALNLAARLAEDEPRSWDAQAPDPQIRIAAKIRELI